MIRDLLLVLAMILLAAPAGAETRLDGPLVQGGLVVGRTAPGAKVTLDGQPVRVSPDGVFVIGFGREAEPAAELRVVAPGGAVETRRLEIARREYQIQRIDGLPQKFVSPPPEVLERIRRENEAIRAIREIDTPVPYFAEGFVWPAKGPISGVYGSQRILNGEPKQPHYGVDIAGPVGTPVVAPAGGVVRLAEKDLYYTGGTVILDHGHGLSSAFLHLDKVQVKAGDVLKRGAPIGTIGATGRVTGAHLDWRMNWFEARIDPQLLVPPME